MIDNAECLWAGRQLYELYKGAYMPWEWRAPIMERARGHGLHCFSMPFDQTAVDFLELLGHRDPLHILSSREGIEIGLLRPPIFSRINLRRQGIRLGYGVDDEAFVVMVMAVDRGEHGLAYRSASSRAS